MDDETDDTTDDGIDSPFDESDDGTDDTNDIETLSNESDGDSDIDGEAWLSDDEEQRPPEYYLIGALNLDVTRLRQRRYSPKTQERLDWVKEHCIQ